MQAFLLASLRGSLVSALLCSSRYDCLACVQSLLGQSGFVYACRGRDLAVRLRSRSGLMRLVLQPLAGWLGFHLRTPASAQAALTHNRHFRSRHGSSGLRTQPARGGVAQRRSCKACLATRTLHTEASSETKRVLQLARQAALQTMPPQSVVGSV